MSKLSARFIRNWYLPNFSEIVFKQIKIQRHYTLLSQSIKTFQIESTTLLARYKKFNSSDTEILKTVSHNTKVSNTPCGMNACYHQ